MAEASVRLDLRPHGADLRVIADELRRMDAVKVTRLFRRRLDDAARPVVPKVKAAALAIPVKGKKVTGLRARIAECVESASWATPQNRQAGVSVWVNVQRMPPGEHGLPLYMEGVREGRHDRWRHPVYGHSERPWAQQESHPYFYGEASKLGPRAGEAMRRAVDDITRQIGGR